MTSTPDIKPRVAPSPTVSRRPPHADAARGRDEDEDFAKPQIGVAGSWNEITPCNLSLTGSRRPSRRGSMRPAATR